jgi:hypothetical protein
VCELIGWLIAKKYTGYLHYRFIMIGSRSLWSPRCSYMWFFLALVWPCQLFVGGDKEKLLCL